MTSKKRIDLRDKENEDTPEKDHQSTGMLIPQTLGLQNTVFMWCTILHTLTARSGIMISSERRTQFYGSGEWESVLSVLHALC